MRRMRRCGVHYRGMSNRWSGDAGADLLALWARCRLVRRASCGWTAWKAAGCCCPGVLSPRGRCQLGRASTEIEYRVWQPHLMYVNDYDAYINGTLYRLDVPRGDPREHARAMRFVGEATGGTVDYRGSYSISLTLSGYLVRVHLAGADSPVGGTTGGGGYIASWTSQGSVRRGPARIQQLAPTLMRNEICHGRPFDSEYPRISCRRAGTAPTATRESC